jgi:hypothetical protein
VTRGAGGSHGEHLNLGPESSGGAIGR